ncbi:MAG: hypothetical protein RB292_04365 [Patescibacteria group bacterium]|jgi:hypothetical protein|nr:hypothetical protein [Patescibacteria group bacterium]
MSQILTKIILSLTIVSLGGLGLSAVPAMAALGGDIRQDIVDNLEPIEKVYAPQGVSDSEGLAQTVAKLIQVALGFLGIVFLVLILYAGFNWMTSAGNEDKISTAKKTMVAAIIGLTIILAAYAITYFVFDNLMAATGTRY